MLSPANNSRSRPFVFSHSGELLPPPPPLPPRVNATGKPTRRNPVPLRRQLSKKPLDPRRRRQPRETDRETAITVRSRTSRRPAPPQSRGPFGGRRNADALPAYLRACLAEQLSPVCTRPARENTQETLFGPTETKAPAKRREDTQSTLFGEPEPLTVKISTRHLKNNSQDNLFGPPPKFRTRQGVRLPADTPDLLHHDDSRPSDPPDDTQLKAIVSRYFLRYQDTQEKLFGGPVLASKPPPERQASNVFWFETRSKSSPDVEQKTVDALPTANSQKPVKSSSVQDQ